MEGKAPSTEEEVLETMNSMLLGNMARLIKQDEERKYPEKDHSEPPKMDKPKKLKK